jgi:hypothetical protein
MPIVTIFLKQKKNIKSEGLLSRLKMSRDDDKDVNFICSAKVKCRIDLLKLIMT